MNAKLRVGALMLLLAGGLAACGGGGSSTVSMNNSPPTPESQFGSGFATRFDANAFSTATDPQASDIVALSVNTNPTPL